MRYSPLRSAATMLASILALASPAHAADAPAGRNLVLQREGAASQTSQRLALVIGNSAYQVAPLLNPANDARAMAQLLREAGFTVMLHIDVDHRGMLGAVRDFGNRLRQGGVGLFYFAGHGMQIKGRNYLIPVGADIQREDEIAYAALDAQAVLDKMESAGNGANLMLLDACRNNPFARSFRSSAQGLAHMEAPVGTLVAFATSPGAVASDGQGGNGLYTQHLLAAMRKPGVKVEDIFKQVRAGVRRDSKGKQIPWEATSLEGDLYFFEPVAAVAPPPPVAPPVATAGVDAGALDDALWQTLRDSRDAAVIHAYLERFPAGRHATQAQRRLLELQSPPPPAVVGSPTAGAGSARPPGVAAPMQQPAVPATASQLPPVSAQADAIRPQPATGAPPHADQPTGSAATTPTAIPTAIRLSDPVPPPGGPAAPTAAALASGDHWTFKITHWDTQPAGESILQVSRVDGNGMPTFVDDDKPQSPLTRFVRQLLWPRAHGMAAAAPQATWWSGLKRGDRRSLTIAGEAARQDGSLMRLDASVELQRRGIERVKVAAGEFDAIRLDADGISEFLLPTGVPQQQRWKIRIWYAAEVRGFVATETEVRAPGGTNLNLMRRAELVRFEPGTALAAR